MIKLPQIPYAMRKNRSQEITLRGLNLSAAVSDGDISDSENVSIERYPYVTEGKTDGKIADGAVSMTRFGQELAIVNAENKLLIGESLKGSLSAQKESKRQMAAINSKLVVFPDKKYYDANEESDGSLDERVGSLDERVEAKMFFTNNSVTLYQYSEEDTSVCLSGYGGTINSRSFGVKQKEAVSSTVILQSTPNDNRKFMGVLSDSDPLRFNVDNASGNCLTLITETEADAEKLSGTKIAYLEFRGGEGIVSKGFFQLYSDFHRIDSIFEGMATITNISDRESDIVLDAVKGLYVELYLFSSEGQYIIKTGERYGFDTFAPLEILSRVEETDIFLISVSSNFAEDGIYKDCLTRLGWDVDLTKYSEMHYARVLCPRKDIVTPAFEYSSAYVTKTGINAVDDIAAYSAYIGTGYKVYLLLGTGWTSPEIPFKPGDTVELSGITIGGEKANNIAFTVERIEENTLYATADVFTEGMANVDADFAVAAATIKRRIPELTFICEANNRLYGCSNEDNTIYVSALGDPTNMFAYEGVSTDSYSVAVADREKFTGCCRYGTDVLFFKENKIYKLVGSYPAEFALYSYDVEGVEEGSHGSLCVINEVLYYKGIHGIYAYTGGVPTFISQALGEGRYTDACAGTDGVSYLLSMKDEQGVYKRFSYNTRLGIWMAEGEGELRDAVRIGDEVYYIRGGDVMNAGKGDEECAEWRLQYAPIYEVVEGKKTHSRLLIRAEIPRGSYIRIDMRCDDGAWMRVGQVVGRCAGIVPIRIPVNRCDKFELRLSGKGPFTILSMQREYYVGSEK